jgi:hypothetical protein
MVSGAVEGLELIISAFGFLADFLGMHDRADAAAAADRVAAQQATQYERVVTSFISLSGSREASLQILANLKEVSGDAIDEGTLMRMANLAMSQQLTADPGELAALLEVAETRAGVLGRQVTEVWQDIVRGISTLDADVLAGQGLVLDADTLAEGAGKEAWLKAVAADALTQTLSHNQYFEPTTLERIRVGEVRRTLGEGHRLLRDPEGEGQRAEWERQLDSLRAQQVMYRLDWLEQNEYGGFSPETREKLSSAALYAERPGKEMLSIIQQDPVLRSAFSKAEDWYGLDKPYAGRMGDLRRAEVGLPELSWQDIYRIEREFWEQHPELAAASRRPGMGDVRAAEAGLRELSQPPAFAAPAFGYLPNGRPATAELLERYFRTGQLGDGESPLELPMIVKESSGSGLIEPRWEQSSGSLGQQSQMEADRALSAAGDAVASCVADTVERSITPEFVQDIIRRQWAQVPGIHRCPFPGGVRSDLSSRGAQP